MSRERPWAMGSRGREAMVTPLKSRFRVANNEEPETERGCPNPEMDTDQMGSLEGFRHPVPAIRPFATRQSLKVEISYG